MANLDVYERRQGDVTILDLTGRIRVNGGRLILNKAIRCLLDEGKTKILLNLASVTHIDSVGLGELISSHVALSNEGGEIKLIHLTERVQDLMPITKLLTVFDVYDNERDALDSFSGHGYRAVEPRPLLM